MVCDSGVPPPQYDYGQPQDYRIEIVSPARLRRFLPLKASTPETGVLTACGFYDPVTNTIYVNKRIKGRYRDKVIRHNIGHANGWRHRSSPAVRRLFLGSREAPPRSAATDRIGRRNYARDGPT